jgi:diaminopimelate decarboxylase
MDAFRFQGKTLYAEKVSALKIAEKVGTPTFVYSTETLRDHFRKINNAFKPFDRLICFSVKSNCNLAVLRVLREEGAGFDIVSGGELYRALQAGAAPEKIVFAGVGKRDDEITAALRAGILAFNVESEAELENIDRLAGNVRRKGEMHGGRKGCGRERARVAVRINPDVDPKTHTYITTGKKETKFGLDFVRAACILEGAGRFKNVVIDGIHTHIGSQITEAAPYGEALEKTAKFIKAHRGPLTPLSMLNIGGGFGIYYENRKAPLPSVFADVMRRAVGESGCQRLLLEPGRFISGNAGILLTRVIYVKISGKKRFLIVDAAMNDLIRPCLYGAFHEIWPASSKWPPPARSGSRPPASELAVCDVVGPVCESGDFLAKERNLPKSVKRGDLLAVFSAGAYGHVMSSNYNSRPRAPEVLVGGAKFRVIRRRETHQDLIALEV